MLTFNGLIKKLKDKNTYMIIGNGSKNQFRYIKDLRKVITKILKDIPINSVFIYFGDTANKKKPDVGYAFELIYKKRPDISIYMIQIKAAKSWGVPSFVKDVYWHNDYNNKCKWGGLNNGEPCSNTKKWVNLHKRASITNIFILGGGKITLDEYKIIKKLKIPYRYFKIERRFLGDGKIKVDGTHNNAQRIGITYNKIE